MNASVARVSSPARSFFCPVCRPKLRVRSSPVGSAPALASISIIRRKPSEPGGRCSWACAATCIALHPCLSRDRRPCSGDAQPLCCAGHPHSVGKSQQSCVHRSGIAERSRWTHAEHEGAAGAPCDLGRGIVVPTSHSKVQRGLPRVVLHAWVGAGGQEPPYHTRAAAGSSTM